MLQPAASSWGSSARRSATPFTTRPSSSGAVATTGGADRRSGPPHGGAMVAPPLHGQAPGERQRGRARDQEPEPGHVVAAHGDAPERPGHGQEQDPRHPRPRSSPRRGGAGGDQHERDPERERGHGHVPRPPRRRGEESRSAGQLRDRGVREQGLVVAESPHLIQTPHAPDHADEPHERARDRAPLPPPDEAAPQSQHRDPRDPLGPQERQGHAAGDRERPASTPPLERQQEPRAGERGGHRHHFEPRGRPGHERREAREAEDGPDRRLLAEPQVPPRGDGDERQGRHSAGEGQEVDPEPRGPAERFEPRVGEQPQEVAVPFHGDRLFQIVSDAETSSEVPRVSKGDERILRDPCVPDGQVQEPTDRSGDSHDRPRSDPRRGLGEPTRSPGDGHGSPSRLASTVDVPAIATDLQRVPLAPALDHGGEPVRRSPHPARQLPRSGSRLPPPRRGLPASE